MQLLGPSEPTSMTTNATVAGAEAISNAIDGAELSRRHAAGTDGDEDPKLQAMLNNPALLPARFKAITDAANQRDQPAENAGALGAARKAAKAAKRAKKDQANASEGKGVATAAAAARECCYAPCCCALLVCD